ncbi:transmembrane protein 14 homolog [Sitodiplosis mosellana]|uniref:transmembrane protein 14 homolog n=1 Tax=Sitodiplosis mosellana TaxID=263140 RepID=UPI0024445423|nr:transmembrane protein 14 homolog [Sitodiplosis mosellana]
MQYDYIGFIVAALIAIGGAIGYFKADSVASLIAGLAFGIILAVGAYFNSRSPPKPLLELVVLLILAGLMFFRYYKSGNFMPAGLTAVIALVGLVINSIIYYDDLRNQLS